jgi:hypothetical protein
MTVTVVVKETGERFEGKFAVIQPDKIGCFTGIMSDKKGGFRGCGRKRERIEVSGGAFRGGRVPACLRRLSSGGRTSSAGAVAPEGLPRSLASHGQPDPWPLLRGRKRRVTPYAQERSDEWRIDTT